MSVWDTLVDQTKDFVTTTSGTALDNYGKKLTASTAPAPAKTVETKKPTNWPLIGGIAAVVIGVIVWLATRKGK